ncbi:hypothetical protein [Bacillus sp. RS11]|uniref:hypothetical protein n=1 Tax=Lysinibacillus sp. RS11 TaxID=3242682 RepID=UPI0035C6F629
MENSDELIQLKITYDKNLEEIEIFLETDKTYKDMEVDEFQKEIKLFWERAGVWNKAWHNAIYSEAKLNKDFYKFRVVVTRLVMGEE